MVLIYYYVPRINLWRKTMRMKIPIRGGLVVMLSALDISVSRAADST
jgi:hypothetical protein